VHSALRKGRMILFALNIIFLIFGWLLQRILLMTTHSSPKVILLNPSTTASPDVVLQWFRSLGDSARSASLADCYRRGSP